MNSKVVQIGQMNFRGNVIDHGWFKTITLDNGKPYVIAITILGEVVYWYKPTEIRDEESNHVRYKQKFKADMLQKNYQQLADSFGFTKRQVKDACDYLKERSLIHIEFRTVFVNGTRCNNVMFIEPVPEEIQKISILYWGNDTPPTLKRNSPPTIESNCLLHSNVPPSYDKTEEPPTLERKTNTEITTNITTENVSSSSSPNCFNFYEENFGMIKPFVSEEIGHWIDDLSEEIVIAAMQRALRKNKRWNYAVGILEDWANNNIRTLADIESAEEEFRRNANKRTGKVKGGGSNGSVKTGKSSEEFFSKYDFSKR
ncbi:MULTISPECIES: DnaD domain-containing protein [Bacillus cereus group]|uniref:DnaD domain-containing protein n=1 Tax=Bacillus cereus group TaxID=86661 RepID=UPI001145B70C|nr:MULTISPECIES: DnaD domain protein [Bacillus cereus group]EKS7866071.1 DnaD domain protein [Bacillus cereus]